MSRVFLVIILMSLVCTMCNPAHAQEDYFQGKVVSVIEGDLILLQGGTRVRLMGIACPQINGGNLLLRDVALAAKNETERQLKGKSVRMRFVDPAMADRDSSEKFAYIYVSGQMFNGLMLKKGLAALSSQYPPDGEFQQYMYICQNEAKIMRRGLWQKAQLLQESQQTTSSHAFR